MGNNNWKLNLSRDFNDWEIDLVVALLNSLQKERVSSDLDKISWKGPAGGSFSISDAFKVLNSSVTPLFPVKGIWVPCVPTKAAFFVWEATWGKILTLDKLQRRGWHLPNRCYLCARNEESEKRQGCLGLRNLTLLNKALLGKWTWRFTSDRDCTWKFLITSKYGVDGLGWCSKEVCGPFRVGLWKEILKESSWVKENWSFFVGNGTRIRFWLDTWCGTVSLRHSFPTLFDLAVNKFETVQDVWDQIVGNNN